MEYPRSDTLEEALERNPHLQRHLDDWEASGKALPKWYANVNRDLKNEHPYNFLYPVGDPIFVHIYEDPDELFPHYIAIQPELTKDEIPLYEAMRFAAFLRAPEIDVPEEDDQYAGIVDDLLAVKNGNTTLDMVLPGSKKKVKLTKDQFTKFRFLLYRDVAEHDIIEPIMKDPWIEDIHCLGTKPLYAVHKIFGMAETTLQFPDVDALDHWLEGMGERMGRPVSNANPVVDGALPNGSRINIVYSDEISKGGSSWTVRKFSDTPIAVTQLIAWGTFDVHIGAYLWLCLENGMSVFVAGETASGKTTTTNGILPFIKPTAKILTGEDTPEVLPPHHNWQQLITRDRGDSEASVTMYDLLKAALRSRPNYVIVGEIRGAEGSVAFQAMQTGHPTMATFHASSVAKLIQRFTSDPINVPLPFMPNLNVVLIQMAVYVHGRMLRRVLAIDEIEGYSKRANTAVTRQVFSWDSVKDVQNFSGRNNSYVLEQLVAPKLGLQDARDIYKILEKRAWILQEMINREMFDYEEVLDILFQYADKGDKALPFDVPDFGI